MNSTFFFLSACLGVVAASAVGPMFVLTFNRSAARGLLAGVVTGMGSATADAAYFFLGLSGFLALIEQHPLMLALFQVMGGVALTIFGALLLVTNQQAIRPANIQVGAYWRWFAQALGLTAANPMVLLFFMAASMKFLSSYDLHLSLYDKIIGSCCLWSGAVAMFTFISFWGRVVGHRISPRTLNFFSRVTGIILLCAGCYVLLTAHYAALYNAKFW